MKNILLFLLIGLGLFSCKDKRLNEHDNIYKFKEYIYETTSGIVSKQEPVVIRFAKDISQYKENSELPEGIVTISPDRKGIFVVKNSLPKVVMKVITTTVFIH